MTRGHIPFGVELTASPIQLLRRYGKVPFTFVTHIVLLIILLWFVLWPAASDREIYAENRVSFEDLFIPEELVENPLEPPSPDRHYNLYTTFDVSGIFEHAADNYYNLELHSPDQYRLIPLNSTVLEVIKSLREIDAKYHHKSVPVVDPDDWPYNIPATDDNGNFIDPANDVADPSEILPMYFSHVRYEAGMELYMNSERRFNVTLATVEEVTILNYTRDPEDPTGGSVHTCFDDMTQQEVIEWWATFRSANIRFAFYARHVDATFFHQIALPALWIVDLTFTSDVYAGVIELELTEEFIILAKSQTLQDGGVVQLWLDIFILITASVYVVLCVKRTFRRAEILYQVRGFDFIAELRRALQKSDSGPKRARSGSEELQQPLLASPDEYMQLSDPDVEVAEEEIHLDTPEQLASMGKLFLARHYNAVTFWTICDVAGSICVIVHSLLDIIEQLSYSIRVYLYDEDTEIMENSFQLVIMAIGVFLLFISLLQYYEHDGDYGILISTLTNGLPSVMRFVVGCAPLYIGFGLAGNALFASISHRFATLADTLTTMFAVLNGDIILEVFDAIYAASPFHSRLFMYSYILLFVLTALNIFIQIMEEAFCSAMEQFGRPMEESEDPDAARKQQLLISGDAKTFLEKLYESHGMATAEAIDDQRGQLELIDQKERELRNELEKLRRLRLVKLMTLSRRARVHHMHGGTFDSVIPSTAGGAVPSKRAFYNGVSVNLVADEVLTSMREQSKHIEDRFRMLIEDRVQLEDFDQAEQI